MPDDNPDNNEPVKNLWQKEIAVRREAQRWGTLSNSGFIGLVGTEISELFAKEGAKKSSWRLPLFTASSASIVVGVVMNWIKGNKADHLRECALMLEHSHADKKTIPQHDNLSAR